MPAHERPIEQIHYSLRREINELYWATAIKDFGVGLVAVFGVIFVYLYFERSLVHTFLFYTAQYLAYALLVPYAAKLMGKVGLKKLMAIGNPIVGAYLVVLALAPSGSVPFIILALTLKIIYLLVFWPSRHTDFAKFASDEKRGRQIGLTNIISALVKAAAPLLGGYIVVQFGFPALFITAAIIISLASIPFFFSPEVYAHYSYTWRETFRQLFKPRHRRNTLAFAFEGIDYFIGGFLYPIFIFIIIARLDTIGWVTSVSLVVALVFTYFIGWAADKRGNRKVIAYTSVVHASAWLFNLLIKTPLQYLFISSFFRLAETANHLPFQSYIIKRAHHQGHGVDEYIVSHEVGHSLGKAFAGLVMIVIFSFGYEELWPYFVLAAIASLLYRIVIQHDESTWHKVVSAVKRRLPGS